MDSTDQEYSAIERALRPCVEMCLRLGIDYRLLIDLLKSVYVTVAESELAASNPKQTDSSISLLTGIHRKDVHALRLGMAPRSRQRAEPRIIERVVARWREIPSLQTSSGVPKAVPRLSANPDAPSFDQIVASVTKDNRGRVLLDECIHQGLVMIERDDLVRLTDKALTYEKLSSQRSNAAQFARHLPSSHRHSGRRRSFAARSASESSSRTTTERRSGAGRII